MMFQSIQDEKEIQEYRKWARDNYKPLSDIRGIWHPIIQDECRRMNEELTESSSKIHQEDLDAEASDQIEGGDEYLSDWNQFLKGNKVS